jgi:hypothetical protein
VLDKHNWRRIAFVRLNFHSRLISWSALVEFTRIWLLGLGRSALLSERSFSPHFRSQPACLTRDSRSSRSTNSPGIAEFPPPACRAEVPQRTKRLIPAQKDRCARRRPSPSWRIFCTCRDQFDRSHRQLHRRKLRRGDGASHHRKHHRRRRRFLRLVTAAPESEFKTTIFAGRRQPTNERRLVSSNANG